MPVAGPRTARSTPSTRCRSARACGRPQPERSVDVYPGASGLGCVDERRSGHRTRRCSRCLPRRRRSSAVLCRSPSTRRSAPVSIAPFGSAGISTIALSPRPSSRTLRSIVAWRSAPTTTRTRGAPNSPSRPTSQPRRCSACQRPAASPTVFALCLPVTNPTDAEDREAEQLLDPTACDVLKRDRGRRGRDVVGAAGPSRTSSHPPPAPRRGSPR